jgi:hypothetical protein
MLMSESERDRASRLRRRQVAFLRERGSVRRAVLAAALVPIVACTALVLLFALAESTGWTPLSYDVPRNVAEAAGMGRGAEVLRFLRQGDDPRRLHEVRPEVISSSITRVTALEAAVWSRRVELIRLLDREGLLDASGERAHLACIARAIGIADVERHLNASSGDCDPATTIRHIQERR